MMRRSRRALSISLLILAIGSLVFLVGWFWFGWGYVAANRDLLRSLPVPRDAELLEVESHAYRIGESLMLPPDGWGTRATYSAPSDAAREEIVDFYVSRLSNAWESCIETDSIVEMVSGETRTEMGNAWFSSGKAYVSVDTKNTAAASGSKTFDVYVDHDSPLRAVCRRDRRKQPRCALESLAP